MPAELIVASLVVIGGIAGLVLVRKWLIKNIGKDGYKTMSIFSQASPSTRRKADPLAEAEVYLAYGRQAQALEVLESALLDDPNRADIAERIRKLKRL
jgi:hypothetical protein